MARSTYVYIVKAEKPDSRTLGAFTVKHECVSKLRRLPSLMGVYVERVKDNGTMWATNPVWSATDFLADAE